MPESLPGDVSIETVPPSGCQVYILRGHGRHQGYGTPVIWSCIVIVDGDQARIAGLDAKLHGRAFTPRHAGAIKRWLIDQGVTRASWERLDGSGFRVVEVTKSQSTN